MRAANISRDFIGVIGRNAYGSRCMISPCPFLLSAVVAIMKRRLITAAETVYDYVENGSHGTRSLWSRWNILRTLLMHRMNLQHSWHWQISKSVSVVIIQNKRNQRDDRHIIYIAVLWMFSQFSQLRSSQFGIMYMTYKNSVQKWI